ncbi:lysoplasmalogenase [Micromonospora endolithica]|uniref:Lysoplasmalogenase n=1 Tax=Micromonospora endolithica TaxID=230091 RepID=A0A3A9ZSV9_9ACTN|nr:lysoplasmalogenase [Micromonospora endolithica]RKN50686.1 lysoplasmalogenase [Micromonospora endolithica]TWJ20580.1 putative membrane protein YhhN [Micromonospora endolithica]
MLRSPVLLAAFVAVTAGNLLANAAGNDLGELVTKPLLMPLLAAYLWRAAADRGTRPDRLVLAALALSTGGDVALLGTGAGAFLTGMALFLGAHACYVAAFVRGGAATALRRPPLLAVPLAYAVLTVAALTWMWPGLADAGLAVPVAGYAIALATMASTATAYGWRVGLGGGLFLLSDLLIALNVAGTATLPGPPIWVMATYAAGQALIVTGWAARRGAAASTPPVTPAAAPAAG